MRSGSSGAPLSLTLEGAKYVFFGKYSNTPLATRNPKFRTEIKPECGEDLFCLFFVPYLNLGAKFRTEIELLSLTKLRKNILPPRNLLNQQKINAHVCMYYVVYHVPFLIVKGGIWEACPQNCFSPWQNALSCYTKKCLIDFFLISYFDLNSFLNPSTPSFFFIARVDTGQVRQFFCKLRI